MLQARFNKMHRGFQLSITVVVDKKKDLQELFGFSSYHVANWVSFMPVKDESLVKNKEYVEFTIVSGEIGYIIPDEWRKKSIPLEDVVKFIDNHRKECRTYQETINKIEKLKK